MTGPHPLWEDKAASPLKRRRVTSGRTLLETTREARCSLTALHNLESRGIGSAELWRRVAAVFDVAVETINPLSPARGYGLAPQLALFPGSSS